MELLLQRSYHPKGTNGIITLDGVPICYSIELPWRNNAHGRSCIPEGCYTLRIRNSPRHHQHLHVLSVAEREFILLHPFNHALKESRGCIGPVERLTGWGTGFGSRRALDRLLQTVQSSKEEVTLRIVQKGRAAPAPTPSGPNRLRSSRPQQTEVTQEP